MAQGIRGFGPQYVGFIVFGSMVRQCIMARAQVGANLDTSMARQTEGKKNTEVLRYPLPPAAWGYAHCTLHTSP